MDIIPYISRYIQNFQWNRRKEKKQEMQIRKTLSCIFVLDTSESMNYPVGDSALSYLNQALKAFPIYVQKQNMTNIDMDISLIQTDNNEAKIVAQFVPISKWKPEQLKAAGLSPIGRCLEAAIHLTHKRMTGVEDMDKPSYPVWILLFTDGRSTDGLSEVRKMIKEQCLKQENDFILWIIAAENADMVICQSLTPYIIRMKHKEYDNVFQWTSDCMKMLSVCGETSPMLFEQHYNQIAERNDKR